MLSIQGPDHLLGSRIGEILGLEAADPYYSLADPKALRRVKEILWEHGRPPWRLKSTPAVWTMVSEW